MGLGAARTRLESPRLPGLAVLLSAIIAFSSCGALAATPDLTGRSKRFLLIHLDAITSRVLFGELEAGNLPNLSRAVAGGGRIEHVLSLFPGGTEMMYPRLKDGRDSTSEGPVGWVAFDRAAGRPIRRPETFLQLAAHLPRRARGQLLDGFGRLELTAGLSLLNLPELLEAYGVVEFFWFATDGAGHLAGEEAYRRSLRAFDRYFGLALARLDTTGLNIIVYGDHGMAFSSDRVDVAKLVQGELGDEVLFYSYPNVYLKNPSTSAAVASQLARHPDIDYAFYREGSGKVAGWHKNGRILFEERDGRVRYLFEGVDSFDYASTGYDGEWLTDDGWLRLTAESRFPGVPANIYRYLSNPLTGDVVLVLNPPRRDYSFLCPRSGHMGLTEADLLVSVLFTGPDLTALQGRDSLWLHELYTLVPGLNWHAAAPVREENDLAFSAPVAAAGGSGGLRLTLSPAYRWRTDLEFQPGGRSVSAEYDVFSSYLARLWLGAGVGAGETSESAFGTWRLEVPLGRLSLSRRGLTSQTNHRIETSASYRLSSEVRLVWTYPSALGLAFVW